MLPLSFGALPVFIRPAPALEHAVAVGSGDGAFVGVPVNFGGKAAKRASKDSVSSNERENKRRSCTVHRLLRFRLHQRQPISGQLCSIKSGAVGRIVGHGADEVVERRAHALSAAATVGLTATRQVLTAAPVKVRPRG